LFCFVFCFCFCFDSNVYIAILLDGKLVTPKAETGLLPGTKRRMLLESGEIQEGIINIQQLREAREIVLFNSVRGKFYATLID